MIIYKEKLLMGDSALTPNLIVLGSLPGQTKRLLTAEFSECTYISDGKFEHLSDLASDRLKVIVLVEGVSTDSIEQYLPSIREANPSLTVIGVLSGNKQAINKLDDWVDSLLKLPDEEREFVKELHSSLSRTPRITQMLGRGMWKLGRIILSISILIFLWAALVKVFTLPPYLLPAPGDVFTSFIKQYRVFLMHMGITAYESFAGFIVGNVLGIGSAIILHRFYRLQEFTMPMFISLQAIPIVALAPLLIVWLGTGLISKVAMAAIICFFPMVVNTLQAFSNVDRDFQELFRFHRADYLSTLKLLLIPASFSSIVSALRISAGLSVVGAIVAELTGANKGLGYLLLNASYRLETNMMFVAMLLSALLGIVFFHLPSLLRFIVPRSWDMDTK